MRNSIAFSIVLRNIVNVFLAFGLFLSCMHGYAQPFPIPSNQSFVPKTTYNISQEKAWETVIGTLNSKSIQIASLSKDSGQISTEFIAGPTQTGNFFSGNLLSRYKMLVVIMPIAKDQTQINIKPTIQARRHASVSGKMALGNNASSDQDWVEATIDNPTIVIDIQNWLYEAIETSLR